MSKKVNNEFVCQTVDNNMIDVETAENLGYLKHYEKDESVQSKHPDIPLICTKKEARNYMKSLPADKARRVGAAALIQRSLIKRQYAKMKRLVYGLLGLSICGSFFTQYLLYEQNKQTDRADALLQSSVQDLPQTQTQYAHRVYATAVADIMCKNADLGVCEATERVVKKINAENSPISPAIKRVIGNDMMAMAKSYEDMGAPREAYLNVLSGYANGRIGNYSNRATADETVKGQILQYLQASHAR